jgi:hypothetical protein
MPKSVAKKAGGLASGGRFFAGGLAFGTPVLGPLPSALFLCKELRAVALSRMATCISNTGRSLRDRGICSLTQEKRMWLEAGLDRSDGGGTPNIGSTARSSWRITH